MNRDDDDDDVDRWIQQQQIWTDHKDARWNSPCGGDASIKAALRSTAAAAEGKSIPFIMHVTADAHWSRVVPRRPPVLLSAGNEILFDGNIMPRPPLSLCCTAHASTAMSKLHEQLLCCASGKNWSHCLHQSLCSSWFARTCQLPIIVLHYTGDVETNW